VRVALLGPLRLAAEDGTPIDLGGTRLRMLLARLALEPGQVVPTEALIDGLWGETPPSDATNALQSLVSRLRRSLRNGTEGVLESHPAGYRLAVSRDDVDVYRFEQLAGRGREELRAGRPEAAAATLKAAIDLWRGPAMADVADAPFAGTATARLAELHARAVEDRIEADLVLGRHDEVLAELRTRLAAEPLRERLTVLLVKALYLAGRQAEALAAYETTRRALADELGVEPSTELREMHLAVLRRDPELNPAPPPVDESRVGRLPARLTSFVGRQSELREVLDRLADTRLVSLVGPGGAGKTRLSTEIAAASGISGWFVELAGVGEAADVATALLTALGLREMRMLEGPSSVGAPPRVMEPMERLIEALAGQRRLIVLDNCEHLISSAAVVADELLAACPELRILATSREPLAITGEVVFPLGPLTLPDANAELADIAGAEATRLFVDRAASARPGFTLDEHNAATVAEICQRLDGLPLALELAAARLRSMTVHQIAERLDDRFRLLTAGSRTSMPRHRTLRAVVEWSWDLLEKPERILARRLSVFAAGATIESATAVCADDDLPAADVIYVLASLVEKSLVEAGESRDRQPRYRMLETVRAYAAERLAEAGERERVHDAYDAYFRDLAEEADPYLRGHEQVKWLAKLSAEQDNLLTAIRHAADAGNADTAIRLAMGSAWYWALSGRQRDAIELGKLVVDLPGPAPAHARAALRLFSALSGINMPDKEFIRAARAELAETNAMMHYPMLAMVEPMLAVFNGDVEAAREISEHAQHHPDPWARAIAQLGRAFLAENEGQAADAERDAVESLAKFRELGDRWGQAMALGQLSERRTLRADHAGAVQAHEQAIELVSELGALDDMPELYARMAAQCARAGDFDGAERNLDTGLRVAKDHRSTDAEALLLCGMASLLRRRGELAPAAEHLDRALALMSTANRPEGHWRAMSEEVRAAIAVDRGEPEVARAALLNGYRAMIELPDLPILAIIAEGAARLASSIGDAACAATLIGVATALRGTPDLGNVELAALITSLKATLGEDVYIAAYDRAAALGREDALAELRRVLEQP
jgi:predicted ATPase/DNA-binding SARP family transcriptional activator